jgi:hypothetical protein
VKFTVYRADVVLEPKMFMTEQRIAYHKAYVAVSVGNYQSHQLDLPIDKPPKGELWDDRDKRIGKVGKSSPTRNGGPRVGPAELSAGG